MAFVLSDMQSFLRDNDFDNSSARGQRNYIKIANNANSELRRLGKWDFDRSFINLTFATRQAPASTKTVSVAFGAAAVTGVGTAFAAADVGKHIRFNGETISYRIIARASTTAITIDQNYFSLDGSNLSAKTFEITNPRVALPSRFRCLQKPNISLGWRTLQPIVDLAEIKKMRRLVREVGIPRNYGIEWAVADGASGTIKAPYLWIYPDPDQGEDLEIGAYLWPLEVSAATDDFGIPNDNAAAYDCLRELAKGHLWLDAGDQRGPGQIKYARDMVMECMADYRGMSESGQRDEYEEQGNRATYRRRLADPGT